MDEIYKKYSRVVYYYLFYLTHDSEMAEELMQETFYSAIKNINQFREECSLKVWLCQIAKNKWKDELKKKNKFVCVPIEEQTENIVKQENIEEDIILQEEKKEFYKKLYELDEILREVVCLHIKGELTFREIGEVFHKSEEWARVTFYRAKLKLKEELNS